MNKTRIRIAYGLVICPDTGREYREGAELMVNTRRPFWRRRLRDGSATNVTEGEALTPNAEE